MSLPNWSGWRDVLLVEDEQPVRSITTRLLDTLGYRVIEAETARRHCASFMPAGRRSIYY